MDAGTQFECNVCGVAAGYRTCPGCAERMIRFMHWRRQEKRQQEARAREER